MHSSDFWLIQTLILCDVAFIVFSMGVILYTFPKRIREAVAKNAIRLDGTASRRRAQKDKSEFRHLMLNTTLVITAVVIVSSVAIFVFHSFVIPLPIAGAAFEQFDWNGKTWGDRLLDPANGVASEFDQWAKSRHRNHQYGIMGVLAMVPAAAFIFCLLAVSVSLTLARVYVRSLQKFEANVRQRHKSYLAHDMKSRFDAVETYATPKSAPMPAPKFASKTHVELDSSKNL